MRRPEVLYYVEHRDKYGHLDQERKAAAKRVNPALLVELHDLFLLLLLVVLVLGPNLLHLGPQILHGAHALNLPDRQGKEQGAHDDREDDYAQPPRRAHRVEELQTIAHHARERGEYPPQKVRDTRYKVHEALLILPDQPPPGTRGYNAVSAQPPLDHY